MLLELQDEVAGFSVSIQVIVAWVMIRMSINTNDFNDLIYRKRSMKCICLERWFKRMEVVLIP